MGCPHPLSLHMLLVDGASEGQARTTYPSFDTVVKQVFNLTKDVRICAYAFKNKLWVTALMKELAEQINTLIDILSQGAQPSTKKAKSNAKGNATTNNSRSLLVENVQKHLEEGLDVMVAFNLAEVNRDERKKSETAPIEPELVVKFVCAVDAIYYWLYNYSATAHGPQKYVTHSLFSLFLSLFSLFSLSLLSLFSLSLSFSLFLSLSLSLFLSFSFSLFLSFSLFFSSLSLSLC